MQMQALGLGRACNPGRFCHRRAALTSLLPPPPLRARSRRGLAASARAVRTNAGATRSAQMAGAQQQSEEQARVVRLRAVEATPESFAPFGQVITASPDGDEFGPHDAQLDLSRGIPR